MKLSLAPKRRPLRSTILDTLWRELGLTKRTLLAPLPPELLVPEPGEDEDVFEPLRRWGCR